MSVNRDLKYRYARLNIAEKLIVVNVVLFALPYVMNSLLFLFKQPKGYFLRLWDSWFALSSFIGDVITHPWSVVTYSFLHGGLGHIFWNMVILYSTGRIFLNLFNSKRFLVVYFLGVILGGLTFVISYNVFPVFEDTRPNLVGASAGVMAVLIFISAYMPNKEVFFFFIKLRLWHIGLFFVVLDVLFLESNSGGRLAHLGGAAWGYLYATQLLKGNDIGGWSVRLWESVASWFKPRKKSPLRTVHKNTKRTVKHRGPTLTRTARQQRVDEILDKISQSGYESLTKQEKDFLFKAGKED